MSTRERPSAAHQPHQHSPARPRTRTLLAGLCGWLLVVILAGCGSSTSNTSTTTAASTAPTTATTPASTAVASGPPGPVLARIGGYHITRGLLAQWMAETVASDFYTVTSHTVPLGLVAEPANYPECVTELHKLTPIPGKGPTQPQPTPAQLLTKCKELYETVKHQAMEYLVSTYWSKNYDAAHGITITPAEARQGFNHIKTEQYPQPAALQELLNKNRRTTQQEEFIVENELLNQKVINKLTHENTRAVAAFNSEAEHNDNNATCHPGYIVAHCKGYQRPKQRFSNTNQGAPDITLEEIGRWRPETSHGFTGQPITH
jgi:hypothetical protein